MQASQKDLLSREKRVLLSLHQHIAEMQPGSEHLAILAEVIAQSVLYTVLRA
jgi:hypothetical protein